MKLIGLMFVVACLVAPAAAQAQEESLTTEPAGSSAWRTISRTSSMIYLADVGTVREADGAKVIRMARAPRSPGSSRDREHSVEIYQFRCQANQWRVVRTEEYGSDGAETDAWDEADSAWLDVPADTNMAFLKSVVCDGEVPSGRPWPRLDDFLASSRS